MLGRPTGNTTANSSVGANYVKFKHVAQDKLKMRSQEAGKYIEGYGMDIPGFGKDLRWMGNPDDHDNLEMHIEDADKFIKRVKKHKADNTEEDKHDPSTYKRY